MKKLVVFLSIIFILCFFFGCRNNTANEISNMSVRVDDFTGSVSVPDSSS